MTTLFLCLYSSNIHSYTMGPRRNPRRHPPMFAGRRDRPRDKPLEMTPEITSHKHEVFLLNLQLDNLKLVNDHQLIRIKGYEKEVEELQKITRIQQATIISQERTVKSSMRTCSFQGKRMQQLIAKEAKAAKQMGKVCQILAKLSGVALHPIQTFLLRVAEAGKVDVLPLAKSPEAVDSDPEENIVRSV